MLFEELGDEGGDFFGAATDAVVFVFDDGELGGGGVGGEVLLDTRGVRGGRSCHGG